MVCTVRQVTSTSLFWSSTFCVLIHIVLNVPCLSSVVAIFLFFLKNRKTMRLWIPRGKKLSFRIYFWGKKVTEKSLSFFAFILVKHTIQNVEVTMEILVTLGKFHMNYVQPDEHTNHHPHTWYVHEPLLLAHWPSLTITEL